jgi:hypothetical protein
MLPAFIITWSNMKTDSLISALEEVGQTPCDKFKCSKRSVCASSNLACTSFCYFVETGKARDPRIFFKYLKPLKIERRKTIEPSREIFESLRPDDYRENNSRDVFFALLNSTESKTKIEIVWG